VFAGSGKDLNTQFILQHPDLLGNSRLRGEQFRCRGGYIEIVVRDFPDIAQLLKLHGLSGSIIVIWL
jgi:hypothetical protein